MIMNEDNFKVALIVVAIMTTTATATRTTTTTITVTDTQLVLEQYFMTFHCNGSKDGCQEENENSIMITK